jgi:hypothetical protein
MAQATADQIQRFANERLRVRAEQLRALIAALRDDRIAVDDIYAGLVGAQSGWTDNRLDGPPRLLNAQDILNYNAFAANLLAVFDGEASAQQVTDIAGGSTLVLTACVRPVQG